jgi:hypothetical protein
LKKKRAEFIYDDLIIATKVIRAAHTARAMTPRC